MASSTPETFYVGQYVDHKGGIFVINNIEDTPLGYRRYVIQNVETNDVLCVPKHAIYPTHMEEVDENEFNWDTDVFNINPQHAETEENVIELKEEVPTKKSRYVDVTNEEIDEIAKARISTNSDKQTKWAVSLFKGKKKFFNKKF